MSKSMTDKREEETQSLTKSFGTANLVANYPLGHWEAVNLYNSQSQFWGEYNSGLVCHPREDKRMSPELKRIMDRWAKDYYDDVFF